MFRIFINVKQFRQNKNCPELLFRNVVRVCRDTMRKAKVHLEFNLAREVKDKKKGFKYTISKWKTKDNVGLLLKEEGALVTEDTEKVELLNGLFASVFIFKAGPQESKALEVREEAWRKHDLPLFEEDCVSDHLSNLDVHKSMGPDGIHP